MEFDVGAALQNQRRVGNQQIAVGQNCHVDEGGPHNSTIVGGVAWTVIGHGYWVGVEITDVPGASDANFWRWQRSSADDPTRPDQEGREDHNE